MSGIEIPCLGYSLMGLGAFLGVVAFIQWWFIAKKKDENRRRLRKSAGRGFIAAVIAFVVLAVLLKALHPLLIVLAIGVGIVVAIHVWKKDTKAKKRPGLLQQALKGARVKRP